MNVTRLARVVVFSTLWANHALAAGSHSGEFTLKALLLSLYVICKWSKINSVRPATAREAIRSSTHPLPIYRLYLPTLEKQKYAG